LRGCAGLALTVVAACTPPAVVAIDSSSDSAGAVEVHIEPRAVGRGGRLLVSCDVAVDGRTVRRVALVGAPTEGQRYLVQSGSTVEPTDAGLLASGYILIDVEGPGGQTLTASVELTFSGDSADATVVDQRFTWSSQPRLLDADAVFLLPKLPGERPTRIADHPDLAELDEDPEGFYEQLLTLQPGLFEQL
jgi:hypothetical protein